jgi:hypothetical protein
MNKEISHPHEELTAAFSATLLNTLLALVPKAVMAVMQTTTMSASMTAYSTAVGPSSAFRNLLSHWYARILSPFSVRPREGDFNIIEKWCALLCEGIGDGCPKNGPAIHPFGNLATQEKFRGPWLCVTALQRFCHFEDEEVNLYFLPPR